MQVIKNNQEINVNDIEFGKCIISDEVMADNGLLLVYKLYFNQKYYYLSVTKFQLLESLSCSFNKNLNYEIIEPEKIIDLKLNFYKSMINKN